MRLRTALRRGADRLAGAVRSVARGIARVAGAILKLIGGVVALGLLGGAVLLGGAAAVAVALLAGGALVLAWLFGVVADLTARLTGARRGPDPGPITVGV